jgi:sec-independent protein translocase protein TatA
VSVMAFFSVGPLEIAVLAVIALLVLGPQKLPEAARSVGKGMREMRAAMSGATSFDDEKENEEPAEEDEEVEEEDEEEDETVPSPS